MRYRDTIDLAATVYERLPFPWRPRRYLGYVYPRAPIIGRVQLPACDGVATLKAKRRALIGFLSSAVIAGAAFTGVVTGLIGSSNAAPSERVARAALTSEAYFDQLSTLRYRSTLVKDQRTQDLRALPANGRFVEAAAELHLEVIMDVQLPDRMRMSWDAYHVYLDEPGVRFPPGCADVSIGIGVQSYVQDCEGKWAKGRELENDGALDISDSEGVFAALTSLSTAKQVESETLRGVKVEVYEGRVVRDGDNRDVVVKIGSEDGLVRYFRSTSPGYFREIERWDFNSPDIVIEAPPLG